METLLIGIASLSTTAAFVLGGIVFKLLRDERQRSDARVQVLMDAAGFTGGELAPGEQQPADRLVPSHFHRIPRPEPSRATAAPAVAERTADDLDLHATVAGVHGMFAEPKARSPWPNRFAAAAACAVLAAGAGLILFGGSEKQDQTPAGSAVATAPLELLALGHSADASGLTISGIVQNPRSSAPLADVIVTASLLAQDGAVVGNVQAPLDFTRLRPGDESPFVVKAPASAGVARYRVSFRNARGGVLGHVDRRAAAPIARHE